MKMVIPKIRKNKNLKKLVILRNNTNTCIKMAQPISFLLNKRCLTDIKDTHSAMFGATFNLVTRVGLP